MAVAPRGFAERDARSLGRIGVGFDGSRESWAALSFARRLAEPTHASVMPIGVLEPFGSQVPAIQIAELSEIADIDDVDDERRADLRGQLENACRELPETVRGEAVICEGDPASELAAYAQRSELHLLILGSRGYGPVRRVLLGGVSAKMVRDATVPVLVVPRGDPDGR